MAFFVSDGFVSKSFVVVVIGFVPKSFVVVVIVLKPLEFLLKIVSTLCIHKGGLHP